MLFTLNLDLFILEAPAQRNVVHCEHEDHQSLRDERVEKQRDAKEFDQPRIRRCHVHHGARPNRTDIADYVQARQHIKEERLVLDPIGVGSIGNGPAEPV